MTILRLFRRDDPSAELDRRPLEEGELAVGRDPGPGGWSIADPTQTLSRRHCVFTRDGGAVSVTDLSANGLFLEEGLQRLPQGAPVSLQPGQALVLGDFLVRVDPHLGARTGQMLDAFCAGAGMDASVFAGEDPLAVMRRLGAVYRRMVLGLGELMDERTRTKAQLGLEWTTVQAADNNPFRWAPPQQVAMDLLQPGPDGFLGGDAAVRSSFEDLKRHQRGLTTGARAALAALLDSLSPEALAEPLKGQSFLMRNRDAALWAEYEKAHAQALKALAEGNGGVAARAFRDGYDKGVSEG